jgi:hypothetical protein
MVLLPARWDAAQRKAAGAFAPLLPQYQQNAGLLTRGQTSRDVADAISDRRHLSEYRYVGQATRATSRLTERRATSRCLRSWLAVS